MASQSEKKLGTEPYKGVRDFYPEELARQKYIFDIWRKTVESFGYVEYNASVLEPSELYRAKSGEEIVNEQTYTFIDKGEREVSLRPEMTPTVARMIAAKKRELSYPIRWYSIPNVFRYERPQRGRLREHWQLNVDMFGATGVRSDVELITVAYQIMKNFGASDSDFEIKVSSRKLLNAVFNNWYELSEDKSKALQKLIDKKNKMPVDIFDGEAEKIVGKPFSFLSLDNNDSEYQEAMAFPEIREAKDELDQVIAELNSKGIKNVKYDAELIRGFDYYTGTIFEVFDTNPQNNRALFGGGRYDDLLSLFSNDKVPAIGFGMGDVTIADFLEVRNMIPAYKSSTNLYICLADDEAYDFASDLSDKLRTEGVNVSSSFESKKSIGDQIKMADKQNIPYITVIGKNEKDSGIIKIKNLTNGEEKELNINSVSDIKNIIK